MPTPAWLDGLWLLVPAGAANMAPVLAARLFPSWNMPVDFGCLLGGQRLLGAHKTWRGMLAGVAAASLALALLDLLARRFPAARRLLPDTQLDAPLLIGAWIGLGALTGDLVKSFFKRRLGIRPGRTWFPFDQLDWLFSALLFAHPVAPLAPGQALSVLAVGLALHVAVHALGRALGLNRSWI